MLLERELSGAAPERSPRVGIDEQSFHGGGEVRHVVFADHDSATGARDVLHRVHKNKCDAKRST